MILDGWGIADHDRLDAVRSAATPNFDRYSERGAYGLLEAKGESVGLPPGGMGNSEVGHLTVGAGRVVKQAHTRINEAIESNEFEENAAFEEVFGAVGESGTLHLVGLLSDAGVHSDEAHFRAMIEAADAWGVEVASHVFTDGRDTPPSVAASFIERLEDTISSVGTGAVATVSGRYYGMDRDQNWERTRQVVRAMVEREAEFCAGSASEAVSSAYERGETDEFIQPTLVRGGEPIREGDAVLCMNFRADRMRQFVRMLRDDLPDGVSSVEPPGVTVVTMTNYDETFDVPVAFPAVTPVNTLGEVIAGAGLTQLRIAETEKYAHVTYFLNGGREIEFAGESREIIPSPDVPTYDLQPEMNAEQVTDTAIQVIGEDDPDVLILNYANPDMVGHTGDFDATVTAVETVDRELGRLVDTVFSMGGSVIVTADHGNADDMGTAEDPHTAHTFNPVPFIFLEGRERVRDVQVRDGGTLADIAPTVLSVLGIEQPAEMTGRTLLKSV